MNKVTVKFENKTDVRKISKTFFREFISGISFTAKENEIELVFDNEPPAILQTILDCNIVEIKCMTITPVISLTAQAEVTKADNVKQKGKKHSKNPDESGKNKIGDKLDEIAAESTSYEDFALNIAKWINVEKKDEETFKRLIIAAANMESILVDDIMKNAKINTGKISIFRKIVSKNAKAEYGLTLVPLLNAAKEYKDYPFENRQEVADSGTVADIKSIPTILNEASNPLTLDEVISKVDMSDVWIDHRVKYVLQQIGYEKIKEEERTPVLQTCYYLVKHREFNWNEACKWAGLEGDIKDITKMNISMLVNDFIKKENDENRMSVEEFIKKLQNKIIFESELE